MLVVASGKLRFVRLVQLLNAKSPIVSRLLPKVRIDSLEQSAKQFAPMFLTDGRLVEAIAAFR